METTKIINYLIVSGWKEYHLSKRKDIRVFQKETASAFHQVTIPIEKSLVDYNQALAEAIMEIASAEGCSVQETKEKIESACDERDINQNRYNR